MPGAVCKIIIDSGRLIAAALYLIRMAKATSKMVGEAILRGALAADHPLVAEINEKLCYWAEKTEAWSAELFKLSSEVAALPPETKKG